MEYQFQASTFADRMIDLEASLQYQGTLKLIWQLNDLYRAGIDYYMEKQPKKAKFLQKKMTELLANPDNLRILEKQSSSDISQKKQKLQEPKTNNTKILSSSNSYQTKLNSRKLDDEVNRFKTVADSCIKNIVDNCDKAANKTEKLKNLDLNKQETKLEDRIALKRFKSQDKMRKILSQKNLDAPFQSPRANLKQLLQGGKQRQKLLFS